MLWEAQVLALERDHQEVLSPKIKRALLMNVLPSSVQTRVMEHLDRLKTYKEVWHKVVSLCHNTDDADIGNIDDANNPPPDFWEGWWQNENFGWREPEPPVEDPDIQGLADMRGATFAAAWDTWHATALHPTQRAAERMGRQGRARAVRRAQRAAVRRVWGNGVRNSHLSRTACNKAGRLKDRC